jgi:4'-phosphopantetheinyl transferase
MEPENIALNVAPGGKPHVAGCEFSISHSGSWLVVAISDAPVGVDIEINKPRRDVMDLAVRFFSASDIHFLRQAKNAERDRAFIRQWVAKEAALKAAGVGLALHLGRTECVFEESAIREVRWDAERFAIHEFTLPDGTPGALAWAGGRPADVQWRDPAEISVS